MGIILAAEIIEDAALILKDKTNVRWTKPEMLKWVNAAMRAIVLAKPNAYTRNDTVRLVFGTKQTLPENAILFMKIPRNMGAAGNKPGRVPRFIELDVLDNDHPLWHADAPAAEVLHYTFDPRDPKIFYVYPPQPNANTGYVDVLYSAQPPKITTENEPIPLDDMYANPARDYVLALAFSKDPANANLKEFYLGAFAAQLKAKDDGEDLDNADAKSRKPRK